MRRQNVGSITFGLLLIGIGIGVFAMDLSFGDLLSIFARWWPIILIFVGIEMLLSHLFSKDEHRHSGAGCGWIIPLLIVMLIVGYLFQNGTSFFHQIPFVWTDHFYSNSIEKSFTLTGDHFIVNHHSAGNVEVVRGADTPSVTAKIYYKHASEEKTALINDLVQVSEGTVTVQGKDIQKFAKVDLKVSLPEGTAIDIDSKVGNVDIKDVSGKVLVRSSVGSVNISGISGCFDIDSKVGSVSVQTDQKITQNSKISASTGSVKLSLAKDQEGLYDVKVNLGSLSSNVGSVQRDGLKSSLYYQVGSSMPTITVDSQVGSVEMDLGK